MREMTLQKKKEPMNHHGCPFVLVIVMVHPHLHSPCLCYSDEEERCDVPSCLLLNTMPFI